VSSARLLLLTLCLAISSNALAWWNEEWTQRKQINIDTTPTGANTQVSLTDVPVLVRLHSGNFPQFLTVRDNGADFRFISGDDLTPLKYHVERFDAVSELAYVWVQVPAIAPQSDQGSFYLYFGNQAAPKADDPVSSFDVSTVAAFHFNETSGLPRDSTGYGTPVTAGQTFPNPASIIGQGATLSGAEPLRIPFETAPQIAVNPETGWTFETWVRLPGLPTEPAYLLDMNDAANGRLSITVGPAGLTASVNETSVTSFTPITAGSWHHVGLVVNAEGLQLYLDGAQVGGAQVPVAALSADMIIGGAADGTGPLSADLDEMRIANVARAPDRVAFTAAMQGNRNDQVLVYTMDESVEGGGGGGGTGSFGIIFQNVFGKPEAWVEQAVIILCGLMMLAAAVIMFLKAVDLSRAAGASKKFLVAYGGLGLKGEDDLDALYGARKQFSDSPLWRIYHIGIDELQKRRTSTVGAQGAGVEPKAMAAIRASMDAAMVRENQRLNSQLVLLTIAISGGPFIGLFGTVVGVMVTFAAIAATGDVNIAAIAPGMAAALLATVAGLGVAIPSLFGYNWLSSKAKEQGADMQVFADELEARFNEQYGA